MTTAWSPDFHQIQFMHSEPSFITELKSSLSQGNDLMLRCYSRRSSAIQQVSSPPSAASCHFDHISVWDDGKATPKGKTLSQSFKCWCAVTPCLHLTGTLLYLQGGSLCLAQADWKHSPAKLKNHYRGQMLLCLIALMTPAAARVLRGSRAPLGSRQHLCFLSSAPHLMAGHRPPCLLQYPCTTAGFPKVLLFLTLQH